MSQFLYKLIKLLPSLSDLACCDTEMEKSFKTRAGRDNLVCTPACAWRRGGQGPKPFASAGVLLALKVHSENRFILWSTYFS